MYHYNIELTTATDAAELVSITSKLSGTITVTDGAGLCVNAKSVLGVLYSMEFAHLELQSENEIYHLISKFIKS